MKFLSSLFVGALGLMALCGFGYCVLLNFLTTLTAVQLSQSPLTAWASGPIIAWQLETPMETYAGTMTTSGGLGHPVTNYTATGFPWAQIRPTGYVGPMSFICGDPIVTDFGNVVLTSGYDDVRSDAQGNAYLHSAVDYAIEGLTYPPPTAITTMMGGQVIYADYYADNAYGNLVVIENNGVLLYLAHMDAIFVSVGDVITAGDQVGLMGNTGPSSAPHVHAEYRWSDNTTFDPRFNYVPGQTEECTAPYASGYSHPPRQ